MDTNKVNRRGFLGRLAAVVGGLVAVPALAQPALAGRSRWRRGGWGYGGGGYGRRWTNQRRYYGGWGRGYGGGWGGYGYAPGYNGYAPGYYGGGYNGYGGGYAAPYYGGNPGVYFPLNGPARPKPTDVLSLLET